MKSINNQKRKNAVPTEIKPQNVFALLLILTECGETFIRPIGGEWENGINDAVEEMDTKYPGCKMKLFEDFHNSNKYFIPNGVSKERILL